MRFPPRTARATRLGATAALLSAFLVGGGTVTATAADTAAAVGSICHSRLPAQAYTTLNLIERGGPFP